MEKWGAMDGSRTTKEGMKRANGGDHMEDLGFHPALLAKVLSSLRSRLYGV